MAGFFYAYSSESTARAANPDWFEQDQAGEWSLRLPRVIASRTGLWLVEPVLSDPDPETGERELIDAGERSLSFVILSPDQDGSEAKRIQPASHQGFM